MGQWQRTRRGYGQPQEVQRGRRGSKRTSETCQARGSAELGKVASGSTTQGVWLGGRIVGSQVILPGRGTVEKVRIGGI